MICYKCGKTINDDSNFCQWCGVKVNAKLRFTTRELLKKQVSVEYITAREFYEVYRNGEHLEKYSNFEEFGLKEFGLKRQQTYNYMNVGKKFLDTNGNLVLKTDEIWNITQLVEMKTLPIKTINEWMENGTVNSTMTAKQIRELVKQNG